jgi:hypothetical protein
MHLTADHRFDFLSGLSADLFNDTALATDHDGALRRTID